MTGADLFVQILQMEGVRQVFCFPLTPIMEAMSRAGLRLITTRQERVAGNMADGVSRSTNGRSIGCFTVQARAGAENAFAPVAHSYTDSTPVLFLPGHPGSSFVGVSPSFESTRNYRATTKMAQKILGVEQIPERVRRAFTALRSGRPQPVLLELLEDAVSAESAGQLQYTPVPRMRSAADAGAVREAAERLLAAQSPLIWAGQGVLYAEAPEELQKVAELLGAPVMTTLQGKSSFSETHELSAGVGAYVTTPMVAHYLREADVMLAVGSSLSLSPFTPEVPAGKTIIHATVDPGDINKEHEAAVPVVADAKLFLQQLAQELEGRVGEEQKSLRRRSAQTIASLRRRWMEQYRPLFDDDSEPINGYRMFRELWSVIEPHQSMLTHDSGTSRDIQCVFYQAAAPRSYLGWGQSSQLGFSLGLSMGAKMAHPEKLVVNVMGDAAVGMTGMDWETAARENIPILTVVKHDSVFSGYNRHVPESIARYKVATETGDYAAIASALGCHAERVEKLSELRAALERGIQATQDGRPAVLDVITAETLQLSRPHAE